ncbi:hypothetical protein DPMN_170284 [Dreissena polymorpha]|uniref:Uncharacterized protein n=1 Tax=Dreissena polymorpha TaxID=45954 RepID=A0A9D4DZH2_DREPO|nr:hypothetical protein DPMN_170284 [Dreissena polymorpha]
MGNILFTNNINCVVYIVHKKFYTPHRGKYFVLFTGPKVASDSLEPRFSPTPRPTCVYGNHYDAAFAHEDLQPV